MHKDEIGDTAVGLSIDGRVTDEMGLLQSLRDANGGFLKCLTYREQSMIKREFFTR